MVNACNFRSWKAEVGGLQILGLTELHSETPDSRGKKETREKTKEDKVKVSEVFRYGSCCHEISFYLT